MKFKLRGNNSLFFLDAHVREYISTRYKRSLSDKVHFLELSNIKNSRLSIVWANMYIGQNNKEPQICDKIMLRKLKLTHKV